MHTQIEHLEALSSHLLDGFLALRERYALLEPMLFDQKVVATRGSGKQARGFMSLRQSLFLICVQDIAKIIADTDKRAPSIRNITSVLENAPLNTLRERYAVWNLPLPQQETDPEIILALRRIELCEETERRTQFDELLKELKTLRNILDTAPVITVFRTIRDKLTAHTEVRFIADKYQTIDITMLGIKWGDMKTVIADIQRAVELIGLLVRNACFAWNLLDEQLDNSATAFWSSGTHTTNPTLHPHVKNSG